MSDVARTLVSSSDLDAQKTVTNAATGERIILVPMAEWKQCAQRGVRTFLQAFLFLGGGGTITGYLTGLGMPPASVANLPTSGIPLVDAAMYSALFAFVVFVWNFCEFWLDIDIWAPKWRA